MTIIDAMLDRVHTPALRAYLEQIDAVRLGARALVEDLTAGQFVWRPDPRRWSIGQCIEHITRTVQLYPAKIETMLVEARARKQRGELPYREGFVSRLFVSGMEPPPRMRVRTMRRVEPPVQLDRQVVMSDFERALDRFAELIVSADGVSLRHARMPSPFAPIFKFTLGQVFAMNLAHARRHLWQARQVRKEPGFPAG